MVINFTTWLKPDTEHKGYEATVAEMVKLICIFFFFFYKQSVFCWLKENYFKVVVMTVIIYN